MATGPVVRKPDEGVLPVDGQYSRSGLEFFKLFPEAHDPLRGRSPRHG